MPKVTWLGRRGAGTQHKLSDSRFRFLSAESHSLSQFGNLLLLALKVSHEVDVPVEQIRNVKFIKIEDFAKPVCCRAEI